VTYGTHLAHPPGFGGCTAWNTCWRPSRSPQRTPFDLVAFIQALRAKGECEARYGGFSDAEGHDTDDFPVWRPDPPSGAVCAEERPARVLSGAPAVTARDAQRTLDHRGQRLAHDLVGLAGDPAPLGLPVVRRAP